ncbi:unnamed protein product [Parascedosporium putredinis]|uniref:Uncharacterized protein n=1 Tax=Parascedosporium putredinis TaxID=1442378 RepID=A0A9P1MB35_9PEZI|nr:unnamed protein product [Parascedosporium putredinis]CAI7995230.1 unnamed protein product [Parascedosporium putredinis]
MGLAGVILGGIAIALFVINNYRRCLDVVTDIQLYQATLRTFRRDIYGQERQIELTLGCMGVVFFRGQRLTSIELKNQIRENFPDDYNGLMDIFDRMEYLLAKLVSLLSCTLTTQGTMQVEEGNTISPQHAGVRNRALFTLGVLLTELYLDTTLATLRENHYKTEFLQEFGLLPTEIDDFDLANQQLDRV